MAPRAHHQGPRRRRPRNARPHRQPRAAARTGAGTEDIQLSGVPLRAEQGQAAHRHWRQPRQDDHHGHDTACAGALRHRGRLHGGCAAQGLRRHGASLAYGQGDGHRGRRVPDLSHRPSAKVPPLPPQCGHHHRHRVGPHQRLPHLRHLPRAVRQVHRPD